jgi:hypothetical protein
MAKPMQTKVKTGAKKKKKYSPPKLTIYSDIKKIKGY